MKKVRAFAPATIANLGVGYDILGLALSSIGDEVILTQNQKKAHQIVSITSQTELPYDIEKNSCTAVILAMQADGLGTDIFVDVEIIKGFKAGSGLGSSAASSVAAAVAFNAFLENPLPKSQLLKYCAEGERIACGAPILDNVSAALQGGLVLIQNNRVVSLPLWENLYALVVYQQIEIKTADARSVLPTEISMNTATQQSANMGLFVHALHTQNKDLLQDSFHDFLAEPYRKKLIPNYSELQEIAIKNKVLGFGISGSGPTVFAISDNLESLKNTQKKMLAITSSEDFETFSLIENLSNNRTGAKVISS